MASAAERVYDLIKDTVEAQGVTLWDVRFLKEGASWYLRVFIDKAGGVNIDDCTNYCGHHTDLGKSLSCDKRIHSENNENKNIS